MLRSVPATPAPYHPVSLEWHLGHLLKIPYMYIGPLDTDGVRVALHEELLYPQPAYFTSQLHDPLASP